MQELVVLDGGMGGELQLRSGGKGGLWSAQALLDDPQLVAAIHQDYVDAGARVLITNTYSTIPSYLAKADLAHRYEELAVIAGEIARDVADKAPQPVLVAGALPPLDESYRWDLVPDAEHAKPIYTCLAQAMRPYVDLYVCETMSCVREAVNAVSAAREIGGADMPIWVSWTLAEDPGNGLRSQESIADAVAALEPYNVAAYLFNCTTPEAITTGLEELAKLTDKPIGAYPNLLHIPEDWTLDNDLAAGRREMSVDEFTAVAGTWREVGASIIGGCCGIGPDFIRALSTELQDA